MNYAALSDEDQHLLALAMTGVAPIRGSGAGAAKPVGVASVPRIVLRVPEVNEENVLAEGHVALLDARAVLSFRRAGVQSGVFRHLQRGNYAIEAALDLRPLRVVQARHELFHFVRDCVHRDIRLVLVKHGKGGPLGDKPPVIKSQVARWLPQLPEVIAFHTARPWHGGASAVYVLIRKSEQRREQTRRKLGLVSGKPVT